MLVCVKKGKEEAVSAVFDKWGLDSTIIGHVTSDGLMTVRLNGEIVSQIPSDVLVLGGGAPVYSRESRRPGYLDELNRIDLNKYAATRDWNETLLTMLGSPNLCHKGWVFEQYDPMVRTNTAVGPGSDAAVLRLRRTDKALAMATDCNGRYCYLNPRLGARSAVAEAARNIVCSGGKPLAITNCLNFGNPYKPEIYYGFSEAVAGMGEACRVFDTPVTGGNVSFYNEDPQRAVYPTPTIGMIGLVEHVDHITTQWFKNEGDAILLIGQTKQELGASEYLHTIFSETRGPVPELDLEFEKRLQQAVLAAIRSGWVNSAHDASDGGLAVALSECCISNREHQVGATIMLKDDLRADCLLFGESQSRVIISCDPTKVSFFRELCSRMSLPIAEIGRVGGDKLKINDLIDIKLSKLDDVWYNALPRMMQEITRG
jgi:phosphoribosylformylglycinamidine synthase II